MSNEEDDHHNYFTNIAIIGLSLYTILFFTSLLQYYYHLQLKYNNNGGKYIHMKLRFFFILTISSLFDMPTYAGCIIYNGPQECEWDSITMPIFWIMHLLALCGYCLALTIPPMLWDDIINHREGKFLFEEYPRNSSRLVFMICVVCYCITILYQIICIICFFKISDHSAYYNRHDKFSAISLLAALLEPIVLLILSTACLFYGIKLQLHVYRTAINTKIQRKLLIQLNFVLGLITLCYLARAALVLHLFGPFPKSYRDAMNLKFLYWMLGTR